MKLPRKFWLWLAAGVVLVVALPFLLAAFWPEPKGTATPPPGSHQAGDVWLADLGGKTTMEMVWCPPGKFMMGSPVSEPGYLSHELQHKVTLTRGFWIGKYEVTQGQWHAIMGTVPSVFPKKEIVRKKIGEWWIPVWRKDLFSSRWNLPVEHIDYNDFWVFCRKAGDGFRLPTETEWEYACRAGSTGAYAGTGILDKMGWYNQNSGGKTHSVGQKQSNAWGLYDMHGNVLEWCWGERTYYSRDEVDPEGYGRTVRGGSWNDYDERCRSAAKSQLDHTRADEILGFRIAFTNLDPNISDKSK